MRKELLSLAVLACIVPAGGAVAAQPPADFVAHAIQGDNDEIRLGQLAERKAASPRLRAFGRMLVKDHTKARAQMTEVANMIDAAAPAAEPKRANPGAYTSLQGMSGQAFDRAFLDQEVAQHKQDIAAFQDEAAAHNQASSAAEQQLPALKKHLAMAEALQAKG